MVHWIPESPPPQGTPKSYEDAVNQFNVNKFAKIVSETGAGYIIFHIAGHKMPAPIKAWEEVHGTGSITKRDLIADLSNALEQYNVRFILGQGLPEIGRFWKVGYQLHTDRFKKIFTEIGHRYGTKLAGTYFDGGREMTAFDVDWEGMFNACKTGNPDRLLSYNFWVFPISTEWLDFWTGEGGYPYINFEERYIQAGAGKGLQAHVMFPIDDDYHWWFKDQDHVIGPPVYSNEQLVSWVKETVREKTVTTLNIAIYQDGTVSSETLAQLNVLKMAIN
jgi:alpha-L-fucosidase